MNFNERIAELAELELKGGFASVSITESAKDDPAFQFIAAVSNKAMPLLREMQNRIADLEDDYLYASSTAQDQIAENKRLQAENEWLRAGIAKVVKSLRLWYESDDGISY